MLGKKDQEILVMLKERGSTAFFHEFSLYTSDIVREGINKNRVQEYLDNLRAHELIHATNLYELANAFGPDEEPDKKSNREEQRFLRKRFPKLKHPQTKVVWLTERGEEMADLLIRAEKILKG